MNRIIPEKKYVSNFNTDGKCILKLSLRLEYLEFMGEAAFNLVGKKKKKPGLIHGSIQDEL